VNDPDLYRRQLETVAENATLALFIVDEEHNCTDMNRAAEELTGFTLAELEGKELHCHVHHADTPRGVDSPARRSGSRPPPGRGRPGRTHWGPRGSASRPLRVRKDMHGRRRGQMRVAGRSRGRASRVGRRGAWLRLAAVLFAYALALCGSPVGQAGFLWMHVATSHHAAPPPAASPRSLDVPAFPTKIAQADPGHASQVDQAAIVAPAPTGAKERHARAHRHRHASAHEHAPAADRHAHEHPHAPDRHAHAHPDAHADEGDRHAHAEGPAGHHEHEDRSGDEAREDANLPAAPVPSVAPDAPHEHGGTWHTHQPHPVDDADVLTNGVSRFYLASREVPPQPRSIGRTPPPSIVAAPSDADFPVEIPPPRLAR